MGAITKAGYRAKVVEKVKAEEGKKRRASSSSALPTGDVEDLHPSKATHTSSTVSANFIFEPPLAMECRRYLCLSIYSLILLRRQQDLLQLRNERSRRRTTRMSSFLTKSTSKAMRLAVWSLKRYWTKRLVLVLVLLWSYQYESYGFIESQGEICSH